MEVGLIYISHILSKEDTEDTNYGDVDDRRVRVFYQDLKGYDYLSSIENIEGTNDATNDALFDEILRKYAGAWIVLAT